MTGDDLGSKQANQRRLVMLSAVAALVGTVGVYVSGRGPFNAQDLVKPQVGAPGPAPNTGQMAAFVVRQAPVEVPAHRFLDAAGAERSLADWRGRVVLLNLWATWCAPCLKEMPDLDRLQAELGSADFEVVAVSVDRAGAAASQKFLEKTGVKQLKLYADPSARLATTVGAVGLPATLLIGRDGREIGRLLGPADWGGEDAKRLVGWALRRP